MKETVYLAGKITGDPLYRSKFYAAARELEAAAKVITEYLELGAAQAAGRSD